MTKNTTTHDRLGKNQVLVMETLKSNRTGATAVEIRDVLGFQGHDGTRQAHATLRKLEARGFVAKEPVPTRQRKPRSEGGATVRFKATSDGKAAFKKAS